MMLELKGERNHRTEVIKKEKKNRRQNRESSEETGLGMINLETEAERFQVEETANTDMCK